MEAMAARTEGGTYTLVIERDKRGNVGRLELHLGFVPGKHTDGIREMLYKVSERLSNEGERDLQARLSEGLAEGLEHQDEGHLTPEEEDAADKLRKELDAVEKG